MLATRRSRPRRASRSPSPPTARVRHEYAAAVNRTDGYRRIPLTGPQEPVHPISGGHAMYIERHVESYAERHIRLYTDTGSAAQATGDPCPQWRYGLRQRAD